ncbi:hypothetical protein [Nonomuraea endophytica]|uniref:hypothetical protein n=1 Tax=Nonomuraea endophytica TaxID=714136 RepID=UPI0037CC006E
MSANIDTTTTRYMCVLTVLDKDENRMVGILRTIDVRPGTTRMEVFLHVTDTMLPPEVTDFVVIHFSLELDAL